MTMKLAVYMFLHENARMRRSESSLEKWLPLTHVYGGVCWGYSSTCLLRRQSGLGRLGCELGKPEE